MYSLDACFNCYTGFMKQEHLIALVTEIIRKGLALRDKYISEPVGEIDYVGVFPTSLQQHLSLVELVKTLEGEVVYSDIDGDVYHINPGFRTSYGQISLLKITKFKTDENRIGYVDFRSIKYEELKLKYIKQPNFVSLSGEGWELIGVEDSEEEVSFYIPNIPLSQDLGIN